MTIQRWTITGRKEWLEKRRDNINGSEIGALFQPGSPFLSPFALYTSKAGLIAESDEDNDAMRRGRIMEPAVANAVREEHPEWKIDKATDYLWSSEWGLGCTPDFDVHCPKRGIGVIQAKTVAKRVFEEEWHAGPPQWIMLQCLQEMMLAQVAWGAVAVLIVEFPFKLDWAIFPLERHERGEQRLITKAAEFWRDVRDGRPPRPDFTRDDEVIRAMFPRDNGKTIDLTGDNRLPELLARFEKYQAMGSDAEKQLKAVKAEIIAKIGDAAAATLPGWEITYRMQKRKPRVVEETTYRVLRVKRKDTNRNAA